MGGYPSFLHLLAILVLPQLVTERQKAAELQNAEISGIWRTQLSFGLTKKICYLIETFKRGKRGKRRQD